MTRDASLKLNSIPCLERTLSYLNQSELVKTSLVCKSWQFISASRLWSNFKFVREKDFERIFHILSKRNTTLRYGELITSLELIHSDREFHVTSSTIYLITNLCPNLLSISIKFHLTRPVAPPVPNHLINKQQQHQQHQQSQARLRPPLPFSRLPNQKIESSFNGQPPATPAVPSTPLPPKYTHSLPLAHFAYNCLKLKSIQLDTYSPKTDDSVYEMAKYMTSGTLESIKFNNCSSIQSSTLCKLAITNPQLRSIEITGNTPVTDSSLATIADRCGNSLEYLSIGNAYQLTDKSIHYVASRCKRIRHICIFNNHTEKISEDTLTAIITQCSTLQTISLSDSRCLGSTFFNSVVQRVNIEIENINRHQATSESGLQRLCLGGVKRDMISSHYIKQLIDTSASKHDAIQDEGDDNDDQFIPTNNTTIIPNNNYNLQQQSKFLPKSTIIRGNTIWWQRRRLILST
ncbi:hypothetical protein G6F37_006853 [Rhizopus arrhizus]|nr:hypothetical protein G6F38_006366 [Rhizopus arrhizus]KAG1157274.1 hypothetical protein G6F37_006853 [Rhizopus arrhizus]